MKKVVLVTGAHGLIAPYVAKHLADDYEVRHLSRNPIKKNEFAWDIAKGYVDEKALENVSYIIHLAGEKFNHGRDLTEERKARLWDTRINSSAMLLKALEERGQKLEAFISASAIGYYAFNDSGQAISEDGNRGKDFGAELCVGWEVAADDYKEKGIAKRVVKLRVSFALGTKGSFFNELKEQVKGDFDPSAIKEKDYFPWIHAEDMGKMFAYAVKNDKLEGVFNTPAPEVTSQKSILELLYYAHKNDQAAFDAVDISYDGKYLSSEKIMKAGFSYSFPEIRSTIKNLMNK